LKKYLLISHKYQNTKRGAYFSSNRLQQCFPEWLDHLVDLDAQNLEELNEQYQKLIFITQVISKYHFKLTISRLQPLNYILFLRGKQNPLLYNSCNNGFYYYKHYKNIKYFVPFVTDYNIQSLKKNIPCIGFYIRRNIVPDSFLFIDSFLKECKYKIDIFIMGDDVPRFKEYKCVNTYEHTYNKDIFFQNITHYMYPCSKVFQDPFPNSVLEAIQTNKQIIFPNIPYRDHKDGIDDIKDCIKWYETFQPNIIYDNKDCILKAKYFKKFYLNLFENNFEYNFDREKYNHFDKWIEREVL